MNQHVRLRPEGRPTTRAAEGLERWRWTTADIEHMARLGIFGERDRFELMGGEIVPMSPVGQRHERVVERLQRLLVRRAPPGLWVAKEPQFNLDENSYRKPDLLAAPEEIDTYDLRGPAALLVIEVADSSLAYDLGVKAAEYARYGVREYWVINAWTLETIVHREPGPEGYASRSSHPPTEQLVPHLAPSLAIRLAELGLA